MKKNLIIFLTGPSSIGKTLLSMQIYDSFELEIINTDSCMIYKYMNIGSGKSEILKKKLYKNKLINILTPSEKYSVFNFCLDSLNIIKKCFLNNKIPIFIGGNMMYNFFIQNYFLKKYYKKLIKFHYFLNISLIPFNKNQIKIYIKKRFLNMLKFSIIEEVLNLKNLFSNLKIKSVNSIGYKDIYLYIENKISFNELKNFVIISTINLSKRQLTWLKKWKYNLFIIESKNKNTIYLISYLIKFYLGEINVKYNKI